jgi:hypothetical protein
MESIPGRRAKMDYGERWVEHLLGRRWPCAMRHHGDGIGLPPKFGRPVVGGLRVERSIYHSKRSGSLLENGILHLSQRTEPGIDGLARTNLRFS